MLQDAYILSQLLAKATPSNLRLALEAFQHVRLPMANGILIGSEAAGKYYEFDSPCGEDYDLLGSAIERQWDWIGATRPEEEVERAITLFKEGLDKSNTD